MTDHRKTLFIFALASLWLALEYFILGPHSFVRVFDVANIHIPQNINAARDFWHWGPTTWYPYLAGGLDLAAEGVRLTNLSAMTLLYLFFPAWMVYPVWLVLVFFTAGYFTFRLGTDHLGLSRRAALFAGLSAAAVIGVEVTDSSIALLPCVLFLMNRIRNLFWIFPLALLFASGSQFIFDHVAFLIIPAWFFFVLKKKDRRFWLIFSLFTVTCLAYYFPSLWAQFANAPFSHRADRVIETSSQFWDITEPIFLLHHQRPGHFLLPLLWIGSFLFAGRHYRFQNARFNGIAILLLLMIGLAYGINGMALALREYIAFFRGVAFSYLLESLPVFLALAGAFGLQRRMENRRAACLLFAFLGIVTLFPKAWNLNRWSHGDNHAALFKNPAIKKLAGELLPDNLFRIGWPFSPLHPIPSAYGLEMVDGFLHLYPKRYQLFFTTMIGGDRKNPVGCRVHLYSENLNRNLLSLANTRYLLREKIVAPSPSGRREKIAALWKRVTENFGAGPELEITENRDVLPRFFAVPEAKFFSDGEALLQALEEAPSERVFLKTAFLEEAFREVIPTAGKKLGKATVRVAEYSPDRIRLEVEADGSGILVGTNSFNPFWKAFVNGTEKKIVPAFYAFWGVPIDKTTREVVFVYAPPYKL